MNKIKSILVLGMLLFTSLIWAEENIIKNGSLTIIDNEESASTIKEDAKMQDFIFKGKRINFKGLGNDFYLAGEEIIFNGESTGSVTAAGRNLNINGSIINNFHGFAETIDISGKIQDSAVTAARTIIIDKDAEINGTLMAFAANMNISGTLNSGLIAKAGEVTIDGPIKGDVKIETGKLIITDRGSINGNLEYTSNVKITSKEKEKITGEITYGKAQVKDKVFNVKFIIIAAILFYIGILGAGILILLLPPVKHIFTKDTQIKALGKTALWGLLPIFLYPVAILITIPLFPISITLLLLLCPLLLIIYTIGVTQIGQLLFNIFNWKKGILLQFLFTLVVLAVAGIIPVIGKLISFAIMALGAGMLLRKTFNIQ